MYRSHCAIALKTFDLNFESITHSINVANSPNVRALSNPAIPQTVDCYRSLTFPLDPACTVCYPWHGRRGSGQSTDRITRPINYMASTLRKVNRGGAPSGNLNAAKGAWMSQALVRALAQDDWKRFKQGVQAVAREFGKGERWAIEFAFDRIQGRPLMSLPEVGDGQLVVSWVMRPDSSPVTIEGQAAECALTNTPDASCQVASAQQATEYALTSDGEKAEWAPTNRMDGSVARKSEGGVDGDGTPPPTFPNSDWP